MEYHSSVFDISFAYMVYFCQRQGLATDLCQCPYYKTVALKILHYRLKVWGWYIFFFYVSERSLLCSPRLHHLI